MIMQMCITLNTGAYVINIRKPIFRNTLVRFAKEFKIVFIIQNVLAFYGKRVYTFL